MGKVTNAAEACMSPPELGIQVPVPSIRTVNSPLSFLPMGGKA